MDRRKFFGFLAATPLVAAAGVGAVKAEPSLNISEFNNGMRAQMSKIALEMPSETDSIHVAFRKLHNNQAAFTQYLLDATKV